MLDLRFGSYVDVLKDVRADLIFTSPPYNIGSKSAAKTGKRNAKLGTYDPKSYRGIREYFDELPEEKYQKQQVSFIEWCVNHLNPNGVLVYNHKLRRKNGIMVHPLQWLLKPSGLVLMDEVVWDRGSTHNHSNKMMWQHSERLFIFMKQGGKYILDNTEKLDYRSDIWRINRAKVNGHNAPFPEELARAVIRAWSNPGDMVIDPYMGSGTTAIASRDLGRKFIGSEIVDKYYLQAVGRTDVSYDY